MATSSIIKRREVADIPGELELMTLLSLYEGSVLARHIQLAWLLILKSNFTVLKLVQSILP